jgi:hypothetical protein
LQLLGADVGASPDLGSYQAKLAKNVTRAQARVTDAAAVCRDSNVKKAKKRLQQAAKAMTQLVHRLSGRTAKKKLGAIGQPFIDAGTTIRTDLTTFRGTVACPGDAPAS